MSRDELKTGTEPGGFPVYGKEQLPKVNTMRKDRSLPDFHGVPILTDGAVMLCSADALGKKPASCYTCSFFNAKQETCALLGPDVMVAKVVGSKDEADPIEYWPCCSEHNYGEPNDSPCYLEPYKEPGALGLIWINGPEVGAEFGGCNCGGIEGGDDCDHYMVESGEKWDSENGFCRVLQHQVGAGQVCAAWEDDDILPWHDAQELLNGAESGKRKLAKEIIGGDK
jgi:hypothetical protein